MTKAEFARRLYLSKGRVTQLCGQGMPSRPDGKLNLRECVPWFENNVRLHAFRDGNVNPTTQALSALKRAIRRSSRRGEPDASSHIVLTQEEFLEAWVEAEVSGMAWLANTLRDPRLLQRAAGVAVRLGCTAAQAFGIVNAYDLIITSYVFEELVKDTGRIVEHKQDVDWEAVGRLAGEDVDTDAWREHFIGCLTEDHKGGS